MMEGDDPFPRRAMLTAILAVPAIAAMTGKSAYAASDQSNQIKGRKLLTAFFTRSGNTRVLAGTIHRALDTDLFEIKAARPYPEDYEATVEQARQERDRGVEPALAATVPSLGGYDAIFLGFPIWGETAPPIIRSFLSAHDFSGKTIRPFITHGGYGLGTSIEVLGSHAAKARIADPFVLEADQERRTIEQVSAWLKRI
nr:flavodoxin [uncultured Dongia sp.]